MTDERLKTDRRGFLKAAALGGAATVAGGPAGAQAAPAPARRATAGDAARAAAQEQAVAEAAAEEVGAGGELVSRYLIADPGSDFILDCLRSLGLEYIALNPGGSIAGLHESIINYGGNKAPELVAVTHEEVGAAMAHGYYKATGKPMAMLFYGTVGLMHSAMAVFNAYADRVPMIILAGNRLEATNRVAYPDWQHAAIDLEPLLTGSLKWYDSPTSLQALAESLTRAYRIAMTEPCGPVLISIDADLAEDSCTAQRPSLTIPPYHPPVQPVADPAGLATAAAWLTGAEYPVLVVNRATDSQAGMDNVVRLAELLGAAVINQRDRLSMPNRHPLNLTGMDPAVAAKADVFLFVGADDIWPVLNAQSRMTHLATRRAKVDAKVITLSLNDYAAGKNTQEQLRFYPADLPLDGSPERSLPGLIEAVQRALTPAARTRVAARSAQIAEDHNRLAANFRAAAALGWDASPISTARMCAELWDAIKDEDWALVSPQQFASNWPQRLWKMDRYYQFRGQNGAGGMGYSGPASLGGALGHSKLGRLPVAIQTDGELMYQPGSFWTAAHHSIPILSVMHNNQGYHQELMNLQQVANRRSRGVANTHIGTRLIKPEIDFAAMIKGLGVWTAGPISDPAALRPAIDRALQVVKAGEPALIDVRTQPR